MVFSLILALAFAVVAVIFALANPGFVTMNFFGLQMEGSLAMFILIAIGVGILIGVLLMAPGAIKRNLALTGQKKKLKTAEKELDQHKSKVTELEDKVKKDEDEKAQAVADVQKRLDETLK
jgi:putative membrane protein